MDLLKHLNPNLIAFFDAKDRNSCLHHLVNLAAKEKVLENQEEFFKAVLDRESIISTGIGMGVAIPHAKLSGIQNFFIVIGILNHGIDWNSLDDAPVRIVFMIGGPDHKQTEYLQILSALTHAIKDETKRKKILTLKSQEAMIEIFKHISWK
jgi:PTS system nitrogen regulatory IIA component